MQNRSRVVGFIAILLVAALGGGCGRGIFSGNSNSGSGGGGNNSATARSVYVGNFGDGKLSVLARDAGTGALSSPVTVAAGKHNGPLGMASTSTLATNVLYVANPADANIHQFTISASGNLSALATIAAGTSPQTVALTASDQFAFAVDVSGAIFQYKIDASTGTLSKNSPASTKSGLLQPIDAVATDSFLYVTDQANGTGVVLTFTINGGLLANGPASTPSLGVIGGASKPGQIMIDPSSTFVFVSDATGLVSVMEAGVGGLQFIMAVATSSATQASGLIYASAGGANYVYCASPQANLVSRFSFNSSTGVLTLLGSTPIGSGLNQPTGLAVDSNSSFLYVTNAGNGTVTQFTISPVDGSLSNPTPVNTESPVNSTSAPTSILVTG